MDAAAMVKLAGADGWLDVLGMRVKFLCTGDDTQDRYSTMLNTVPKGLGAPPHVHPWDEAFYVIRGRVEFRVDEQLHQLRAGDYVRIPANTVHAFRGISEEEGLLIGFEAPSHSVRFFREIHESVRCIPDDLSKMPTIGNRYGVTFVE